MFLHVRTANCGYPDLLSAIGNDSMIRNDCSSRTVTPTMSAECPDSVQNLIHVEGCKIRFSCPPGLVLNGSNSATCTGNGEWEPDPSWLTCGDSKGKELFYALCYAGWGHYCLQTPPPSPFKSTMAHSANKIRVIQL
jgi:hypothetical protein